MPPKPTTFRPRARLMLLLGDQLIRDAGIAVFELVKNAYDADATTCKVTLKEIDKDDESAQVVVQDNGCGMHLTTVTGIWLEPGTENRKKQKDAGQRTPKFKRLPLGEKGVGRFAVHKLGRKVRLVTRAKGKQEVVVTIDWSAFDKDKFLSQVPVKVIEREPVVFKGTRTGTRITIDALHERPWTRARVRSMYRAINSICSPVLAPDSFNAKLEIEPESDWLDGLLTADEVLKQAIFTIEGTLSGSRLSYDYHFRPGPGLKRVNGDRRKKEDLAIVVERSDGESRRKESRVIDLDQRRIGDIRFSFHIFDREPRVLQLTSTDVAGLKSFLDNNGGVFVYRDGVRVYDYGEPGNDWLDLGGRRINVPAKRIGNNQILGTVQLSLDDSQGLIEKTNREGFVENNAYRDFRDAIHFAIKQAEHERNLDKDRIRKAYAENKDKEPVLDEIAQLREEVKERELEKDLGKYLDRIEVQYKDVLNRLLVAAGAGLNLSVVLHEVEKRIADLLQAVERGDKQSSLIEKAKTLSDMVDGITWLTRSSGPSVVKASTLISQAELNWKFRFQHHEIKIVNGFSLDDPDPEFAVKCNRRLIMGALMNLIDNAIYWLGTRASGRKLYLGTTYELNSKPGILVADNGPGFIDPPEYLVEPFVTRKPDGMGLGLHIAHEVMKQHKGQLAFLYRGDVTLPKEFTGAALLLEFPKEA
jgi:signal transduction histidine kinase